MGQDIAVALGANIGGADLMVSRMQGVLDAFRARGFVGLKVSRVFKTKPLQTDGEHEWYLNCVFRCSDLKKESPTSLLEWTQSLEHEQGRNNKGLLKPRTMDIDILWIGNEAIQTEVLTLPHPRIKERRFVLEPLLDLYAKDFKHRLWSDSLESFCQASMEQHLTVVGRLLK